MSALPFKGEITLRQSCTQDVAKTTKSRVEQSNPIVF